MNTPFGHKHTYQPTAQDQGRLKEVTQVINSLYENIQLGKVDNSTQEIIGGHFFNSMQYLFEQYFEEQYTLENLFKSPYLTLFEAAMLIGWLVNPNDPDCLLIDPCKLFSEAFLNGEISPRNPRNFLRYDDFHQVPRAGITINAFSKSETIPENLGHIDIQEVPDLFWLLNKKEVAEFAILKGYPEELFNDFLGNISTDQKLGITHTSELLEIMAHCIADNWEKHDPKKPPKNEVIKKWFRENYPDNNLLSDNVISAMCTIIRPEKYKQLNARG